MATGDYDLQQRASRRVRQARHHVQPNQHPAAKKNMKEVAFLNKEEVDKHRSVRRRAHSPAKTKRVSVCKRKGRPSEALSAGLLRQKPHAGPASDSDMANKENELTCAEDVQGVHYNDGYGFFPVNSAEASKMAGAGSKYGDYITQLSKDHEAMTHVLFGRNLRLNVALTLWRRNASELVAYLIRIEDTSVLLDCLPIITRNLQVEAPCISLGCCVDLLPQVKIILASEYEEHLVVGLHWVQAVIKKWWPDLSANGKTLQDSCSEYRNLEVMKQRMKDMWKEGAHLCSVPGTTGEMAKAIESYLSQLR